MKQALQSKFILDRKELNHALLAFKRLIKKGFDTTICNLRVMPGGVEISTPGIARSIHGETEGLYEFLVPIKILFAYSSSSTNPTMSFVFRDGQMECDRSLYSSPMIKIKNWQSTPIDELPMNYTDTDVIKLAYKKGADYLEENNLQDVYKKALNNMEVDIHSVIEVLSKYELKKQDVRDLIEYRLKKNLGIRKS